MAGWLEQTTGRPPVRCSDDERDRCVRDLRWHYAAGRLDEDDLEDRIDRVTRAQTRAELRAACAGLPSRKPARAVRAVDRAERFVLKAHAVTFTTLNGGLVGVWAATGQDDFWPGWVLAPTSALLASHAGSSWTLRRALRRRRAPRSSR